MTKAYTDKWQQWWMNPENVQLYQFMGKDSEYVLFDLCLPFRCLLPHRSFPLDAHRRRP